MDANAAISAIHGYEATWGTAGVSFACPLPQLRLPHTRGPEHLPACQPALLLPPPRDEARVLSLPWHLHPHLMEFPALGLSPDPQGLRPSLAILTHPIAPCGLCVATTPIGAEPPSPCFAVHEAAFVFSEKTRKT